VQLRGEVPVHAGAPAAPERPGKPTSPGRPDQPPAGPPHEPPARGGATDGTQVLAATAAGGQLPATGGGLALLGLLALASAGAVRRGGR
jgi:hypothetical protein